jgi:hypothetical protein
MNDWAARQHQQKADERNQIMDRAKRAGVKMRARGGWACAGRVEMDLGELARLLDRLAFLKSEKPP